jgi:nucleoside-diphosphate-sugar epimerase
VSRRVAVTGASGFVGRAVLGPLLARGFEVHAIGRCDPMVSGVRFHLVDLRDDGTLRAVLRTVRPDRLLHLAWSVDPQRFWTAPENAEWVGTSVALVRAAIAAGTQRIVGVGTCAEYDWQDGGASARREDDPVVPDTPYGAAKCDTHVSLTSLCAEPAVALCWARLFHLIGEHQSEARLVPSVARALLAGHEATLGPGHFERDFCDVRDVGQWLATLVDSTVEGAMNVASGRGTTVRQVGESLGVLTGRPDLLRWRTEPGRPGEPARMLADIGRLRKLPELAAPTPLAQTLARCVASLRFESGPA